MDRLDKGVEKRDVRVGIGAASVQGVACGGQESAEGAEVQRAVYLGYVMRQLLLQLLPRLGLNLQDPTIVFQFSCFSSVQCVHTVLNRAE